MSQWDLQESNAFAMKAVCSMHLNVSIKNSYSISANINTLKQVFQDPMANESNLAWTLNLRSDSPPSKPTSPMSSHSKMTSMSKPPAVYYKSFNDGQGHIRHSTADIEWKGNYREVSFYYYKSIDSTSYGEATRTNSQSRPSYF